MVKSAEIQPCERPLKHALADALFYSSFGTFLETIVKSLLAGRCDT